MSLRRIVGFAFLASLLLVTDNGVADQRLAAIFAGGSQRVFFMAGAPAPGVPQQHIRLDAGHVTIRLMKHSYVVDSVFQLVNSAKTKTVLVGVPCTGWGYGQHDQSGFGLFRLDVWVDGRRTVFSWENDLLGTTGVFPKRLPPNTQSKRTFSWMIGQITFRGHAATIIRVRYEAPYISYDPVSDLKEAGYLLGSARYWAASAGRMDFIVDCTEIGGRGSILASLPEPSPEPHLIGNNVLYFGLRNYEPDFGSSFGLTISSAHRRKP